MFARRRLSAADRVSAGVLSVLVAGVVLLSAIAFIALRSALAADLDRALVREVEAYSAAISPLGEADERDLREASRAYLEGRAAAEGPAMILLVRFADGRVLSNSELDLENADGNTPLLAPASAARNLATLDYKGTRYRTATAPVQGAGGKTIAVFQAASSLTALSEITREVMLALAIASLSVVAAGVLISRVAALRALRPLKSMAQDAARVTHSSLQERVAYKGPPDELGTLADSLNAMLDRLEGAFEEQRRFVADASHELRTPVAVIRGHLDLLGQPWVDATEREESLRIVDDEIGRMQRLLDDMLALARVQPAPSRPFQRLEVSTMLAEAAARGRSLGTREFERTCESDLWVEGDPDLLEAALQNLIRNAIEHTTEGGHISLSCRRAGTRAVIEIADDGPGIREEDLPRIFDRFFRTSGPRPVASGGSGLGLAIVQRLIETHDGSIAAANRPEGGAVFRIELPVAPAHDAPE